MRFDYSTHTEADAGRFERMHNGFEDSDYDREDEFDTLDLSTMTRCPFGCRSYFHGETDAYHNHVALHEQGKEIDPWLV